MMVNLDVQQHHHFIKIPYNLTGSSRQITMAKFLIAAATKGSSRMHDILKPPHELVFVTTLQEGLDAAAGCDLFVCGLEFDESRMFDFLRRLNENKALRLKPRVCVRFFATNTPDNVIDGLEVAARAVGAHGLIDVPALEEEYGIEGANQKVREEIESALNVRRS
jgi:hypothetical protein